MDKRSQRTFVKMDTIKRTALELFATHGVEKVGMDEIAAKANVSKVTIYKYFGSKEELYAQAVNLFVDETLAATEELLNSEMNFLEKLKSLLRLQISSSRMVSHNELFQIWEQDALMTGGSNQSVQTRVKGLMYKFFDEGKREGYIHENLSFEMLYLYADIFRAGLKATAVDLESVFINQEKLEELYQLYFFGFIKRS